VKCVSKFRICVYGFENYAPVKINYSYKDSVNTGDCHDITKRA